MSELTEEQRNRVEAMKNARLGMSEEKKNRIQNSTARGIPGNITITVWLDEEHNSVQPVRYTPDGSPYYLMQGRVVFPFHGVRNSNYVQVFNNGTSMVLFSQQNTYAILSLGSKITFSMFGNPVYAGIASLSIFLKRGIDLRSPDPITGKQEYWNNINLVKNGFKLFDKAPHAKQDMFRALVQTFNVTPLRSVPLSEFPTPDELDVCFTAFQKNVGTKRKPRNASRASSSRSSSNSTESARENERILEKYSSMSEDDKDHLMSTVSDSERAKVVEELKKFEELKKIANNELEEQNKEKSFARCFHDKLTNDTHRFLLKDSNNSLYHRLGACEGLGSDGMVVVQYPPEIIGDEITREVSKSFKNANPSYVGAEILTCNVLQPVDISPLDGSPNQHVSISTTLWHTQMHQLCGIGLVDTAKALFPRLLRSSQAILQCGVNAKDTIGMENNTAAGNVVMDDGERVSGWHVSTFSILSTDPFAPILAEGWEVTPRFAFELMRQHMLDYGERVEDENSLNTAALAGDMVPKKITRFSAERRKLLAYAINTNPYHTLTKETIQNLTESKCVVPNGTEKRNSTSLYFVVTNALDAKQERSGVLTEARALYEIFYNEPNNKERRKLNSSIQSTCESVSEFLSPFLVGDQRKSTLEFALFQVSRKKYESLANRYNYELDKFTQGIVAPDDNDTSEAAEQMRERIMLNKRNLRDVLGPRGFIEGYETPVDESSVAANSSSASSVECEAFVHDSQPTPEVPSTPPIMEDDVERTSSKRKRS